MGGILVRQVDWRGSRRAEDVRVTSLFQVHAAALPIKILRGANPADLPVAGATQFTFSASRSALAKLGLSLPPDSNARVNDWLD
jgi:hypothetical protein